ncbi:response regulator [Candidatus Saccharibacteria bacterium]|nr:MAG: response regulator [Candidatus Saccharibacteria bacterium]
MAKILLVEDDKSLREIYGVRLLAEGYDIVSAGDGEEALAMAIKDRPDLIVSDVMMPKISGFDMLDILRSTTETKGIKVIMMTALSSEDQRQRGVALGADRYLVKSQVGIEDVVRTVHEVLADAPVTAPTLLSTTPSPATPAPAPTASSPAPVSLPQPPVAPLPVSPAPVQPVAAPVVPPQPPATTSTPTLVTPPPTPVVAQPTPTPTPAPASSTLPQPSAPFSTPRNTLADRVIEPLTQNSGNQPPDFGHMMNQELAQANPNPFSEKPAVEPGSTSTNIPPAPPSAIAMPASAPPVPSGLSFEETPRPANSATPPLPPAPQPPNPGV